MPDKEAPALRIVKTTSPTSLTVEFNEPVMLKDGIFSVSGNEITATSISADGVL